MKEIFKFTAYMSYTIPLTLLYRCDDCLDWGHNVPASSRGRERAHDWLEEIYGEGDDCEDSLRVKMRLFWKKKMSRKMSKVRATVSSLK
jgi:hypothetical protein